MANWFKIYETDLDDKRLKWALNKLPEVGWVFIGILSECCKSRSDSIRWSPKEHDLFGFSDALKVSIPKVNEAVNLLIEIEYIELKDDKIRVIRWNEKQSEYNIRKQRGDYRRVSDNIGDSPLEERRGEENRGDKKKAPSAGDGKPKEEKFAYSPETRVALHYLNEKSGRHFRESESNLKVIQARLKEPGVDIAGVRLMIDRQCRRWKGTPQEEYLRPETLFGKTKFDGYYAARELPVAPPNGKPTTAVGGRI